MPALTYRTSLRALKYGKHDHWVVKMLLNGGLVHAIVDTGCGSALVLSRSLAERMKVHYVGRTGSAGTAGGQNGYRKIRECAVIIAGIDVTVTDAIAMDMPHIFTGKYQCVIGLPLLKKTKAVLDITARKMLFK